MEPCGHEHAPPSMHATAGAALVVAHLITSTISSTTGQPSDADDECRQAQMRINSLSIVDGRVGGRGPFCAPADVRHGRLGGHKSRPVGCVDGRWGSCAATGSAAVRPWGIAHPLRNDDGRRLCRTTVVRRCSSFVSAAGAHVCGPYVSMPSSLISAIIWAQALRASSTETSSSMVLMSPGSRPRITALKTRRMILPERVLGNM